MLKSSGCAARLTLPLFTLGLLVTLSKLAEAQVATAVKSPSLLDGDSPFGESLDLEEANPGAREEEPFLPPRLASPAPLEEDPTVDETLRISPALVSQSSKASRTSFFDFSHAEWGFFGGLVDYSSSFKGKAEWALGLDARVPVPGLALGRWGLFAEAYVAYLDRNLPFFYVKPKGTWYGGAVGADYTLARGDVVYFRLQGAIDYSYFNKINSVDNGFGGLVGAQLGFFWIRQYYKTSITITPQIVSNGTDWYILGTVGASFEF